MYHPNFKNMTNVQVHVDFVRNKRSGQSLVLGGYMYINYLGNSCQSSVNICNQFGLHQVQQKVSRDQYPNRLTLWVGGLKSLSLYRGKQCRP